jgi:signal transduction histidine kinase
MTPEPRSGEPPDVVQLDPGLDPPALRRLAEIGALLHGATDLARILRTVLVAATARQGAGMNRAFLLLPDESCSMLRGEMAVGPSDASEAHRVWSALKDSGATLTEMLSAYDESIEERDVRVNEIVGRLGVPLDREDDILTQAYRGGVTFVVGSPPPVLPTARRVAAILGAEAFAVVPVLARRGAVGLLVADNLITGRPISTRNVDLLELLACQAGLAIENARLAKALSEKVEELRVANEALKQEQEKVVRAERLSAVGEMAARVAHEIRNPLVSIGGFARRLLVDLPGEDARTEPLRIIRDEVARLERTVGDVLDFVRPAECVLRPTDVNEVVRRSSEIASAECEQAGVRVTVRCTPDLPLVAAEPSRLKQALLNLLRNAAQAMPRGGDVLIATAEENEWVVIHVSDTGEGIPEDKLREIFEPFYTTRSQGTGLGLPIVAQLIGRLGGRIEAESAPGQGARFTIRLPRKEVCREEDTDRR